MRADNGAAEGSKGQVAGANPGPLPRSLWSGQTSIPTCVLEWVLKGIRHTPPLYPGELLRPWDKLGHPTEAMALLRELVGNQEEPLTTISGVRKCQVI